MKILDELTKKYDFIFLARREWTNDLYIRNKSYFLTMTICC